MKKLIAAALVIAMFLSTAALAEDANYNPAEIAGCWSVFIPTVAMYGEGSASATLMLFENGTMLSTIVTVGIKGVDMDVAQHKGKWVFGNGHLVVYFDDTGKYYVLPYENGQIWVKMSDQMSFALKKIEDFDISRMKYTAN